MTYQNEIPTHRQTEPPVLVMEGITKRFGPVVANDRITFTVRRGTVHALLGENGAGKTTLMNILYGLYHPDSGRISLRGRDVRLHSPRSAIQQGIGMIHQQFMLIPQLTVAENIVLGLPPRRRVFLDLRAVEADIRALSKTYRLDVEPGAPVWQLSVGMQQRVEILKALYRQADVLILDEPTSVLTPAETTALFDIIRTLVRDGHSVIFISHKLDEVMAISDEVTVLRAGRVVDTVRAAATSPRELARMMVGREVVLRLHKTAARPGKLVLQVQGLSALNDRGLPALGRITFDLYEGEILGIAGVDGNGQAELAEVIAGLRSATAGSLRLKGRELTQLPPYARRTERVAYIPADRQRFGIVLDFSVADNLVLKDFHRSPFVRRGLLNAPAILERARHLIRAFDIRAESAQQPARTLSGGNQQKVVLAREASGDPRLVLAMQPTRGLDVGASEYVLRAILSQRDRGAAVLYISTELDEILTMSDRVAVLFNGQIMGIVRPQDATLEQISMMMAGSLRLPETSDATA